MRTTRGSIWYSRVSRGSARMTNDARQQAGHRRREYSTRVRASRVDIHQTSYTYMRASRARVVGSRIDAIARIRGRIDANRARRRCTRAAEEPAKRMNIPRVQRTPNAARCARPRQFCRRVRRHTDLRCSEILNRDACKSKHDSEDGYGLRLETRVVLDIDLFYISKDLYFALNSNDFNETFIPKHHCLFRLRRIATLANSIQIAWIQLFLIIFINFNNFFGLRVCRCLNRIEPTIGWLLEQ